MTARTMWHPLLAIPACFGQPRYWLCKWNIKVVARLRKILKQRCGASCGFTSAERWARSLTGNVSFGITGRQNPRG